MIHSYYICFDLMLNTVLWIARVYFVQFDFVPFFSICDEYVSPITIGNMIVALVRRNN